MATRKKLPATLAVAALTATLYGCGGGGDNRFVDLEDQLERVEPGTKLTADTLQMLLDEREDASAEITRLEGQVASRQEMLDMANAEVTRLEGDVTSRQEMLDMANAEVTRLEGDVTSRQEMLDMANAEVTRLEGDVTSRQEMLDMANAEVTRLEGDVTSRQEMLDMANAEVTRLEGDVTSRQEMLDMANAEVTRLEGDVTSRQEMLDMANAEVTRLEGDVTSRQEMLEMANAEVTRLEGEVTSRQEMLEMANAEITRLEGEVTSRQGMLEMANAEITRLEGEVTSRQGMLEMANAEVTRLEGEVTRLEGEVTSRQGMLEMANAEVTRLEGEVTSRQGMLEMANAEVTRLEGEVTRLEGEVTSRQGMLEMANAEVTRLEAEVTRLEAEVTRLQALEAELIQLKNKIAQDMADEERKERVAMVKAVEAAVKGNRVDSTTSNTFLSRLATNPLKASRGSDGMVTIDLNAASAAAIIPNSTSGDGPFSDESAPAGDGMWTRVELTRDRSMTNSTSDKSDAIMVYTDIEASMDVGLLETEGTSAGFVVITGRALNTTGNGKIENIELDSSPATDTITIYQDRTEFDGMYQGISGTFQCVGGTCAITATMNSDGENELEFHQDQSNSNSNRLRFTPDDAQATYPAPDMEYSYFGWWLGNGAAGDPEKITDLQPFHGGVGNTATVDMAVTGTASYTGEAHGKYVTGTKYAVGELTDGQHGLFEATAMLTADFGDATSAGNIVGNISGEVNNFDTGDDGPDSTGWSVTLRGMGEGDSARPTADITDGNDMAEGNTDVLFGGFNHDAAGRWKASFHDSGETSSDAPGTITGIFDAVVEGVGLLTGGFGAKMDMPPAEQ